MIIVLSYNFYEQGTDPVIDWLLYYQVPFVNVSVEDLINGRGNFKVDVSQGRCYLDGVDIHDKIQVIYYRRFFRNLKYLPDLDLGHISKRIQIESNGEIEEFLEYLFFILQNKVWLPKPQVQDVNKLIVSRVAFRQGFLTPASIVTNNKVDLIDFYEQHQQQVICKPINRISYYTFSRYTYSAYTTSVTNEIIEQLPDHFFPSLFQSKVEAEYEVRVFYLDGQLYASAILVGQMERRVDIKQTYEDTDTHWVPYKFPPAIESAIVELMNALDLNTGSIDIIVDKQQRFHFIEVNPVGQYKAPSFLCNHQVDKLIAEWLISKLN